MANPLSDVLHHLRRGAALRDEAALTDGQLLERYVRQRQESAFASLVQQHGPMVWGVCRRMLGNHHDAEDAFQATFLVLVRKGASILPRETIANWLYGVAHLTALKARAIAVRRKERERQVTVMPEPAAAEPDLWRDLQPILDQELSRLPDKYRTAIVLCDLEGKTRKEAAQQLGCPEGTVAGRLARARTMLAKRLARHGLGMSGGALATALAQNAASAGVPASVASSTINAAALVAAGQTGGVISASVVALMEGVVKSMLLTKLKIATVVLLAVLAGCGVAVATVDVMAAGEPQPMTADNSAEGGGPSPGAKKPRGKGGKVAQENAPAPRAEGPIARKGKKEAGEKRVKAITLEEAVKEKVNQKVTVQFQVGKVQLAWHTGFGAKQPWVLILTPKVGLKDGSPFQASIGERAMTHIFNLGLLKRSDRDPGGYFRDKVIRVTGKFEGWPERDKKGMTYRICIFDLDHIEVVE
jgi:RNA polymerase sigma factor (sigma-70 family)